MDLIPGDYSTAPHPGVLHADDFLARHWLAVTHT
jgi:hypothetical protein